MVNKLSLKSSRIMLHSIQPHAAKRELCPDPFTPSENISSDFCVGIVQVGKHQKVVVAVLVTDILGPSFIWTDDFVYSVCFLGVVPVDATEVVPVVFHGAVCFAAAGEVVAYPTFNFFRL